MDEKEKLQKLIEDSKVRLKDIKQETTKKLENVDQTYRILDETEKVFHSLNSEEIPTFITQSGINTAGSILSLIEQESNDSRQNNIGTALIDSRFLATSALSAVTVSQVQNVQTRSLQREMNLDTQNKEVSFKLNNLNPVWSTMYQNAWKTKSLLDSDVDRQSVSNIRELIEQILEKYAPDNEVKKSTWGWHPNTDSKSKITREHRVRTIAEKLKDKNLSLELVRLSVEVKDISDNLSKLFHKRGEVLEEESKNELFRSINFLEILLKSIEQLN